MWTIWLPTLKRKSLTKALKDGKNGCLASGSSRLFYLMDTEHQLGELIDGGLTVHQEREIECLKRFYMN